jgi:hypothetical protein
MLKKRPQKRPVFCDRKDQVMDKIRNGFSKQTLLFGIGNYKGMDTLIQQIKTLSDAKQN